ncbi:MAG TPA: transglycosylase SLT domain-containing protein [Candidatus Acidoferrales bacterium]|nr:transglycosylase SLT domain-containing protein [Candidatus Acidoferrales bacterium]
MSPRSRAEEAPFPVLPGLESAVEFWKLIFTRFSVREVVFHDPEQPLKIYKVLEIPEGPAARELIEAERERVSAEHGFTKEEARVRAQRGTRERFGEGLRRSRLYLNQMKRIFAQEGVPTGLVYLPLVESSFHPGARSPAGAVGMWQFIYSTGKEFLRIDKHVDERKDPLESTRAAARLLKRNYEALGNWPLAITAYNHGRSGMLRAVSEVGSDDLVEIIRRYQGPAFGFASKNFYAEFLAALEVVRESEEHFPDLVYPQPILLEELELARPLRLAALLKPAGISRDQFLEWNPALNPRLGEVPKGYRLKVPAEKFASLREFVLKLLRGPAANPAKPARARGASWTRHRVQKGETLSAIARRYNVSVMRIQKANSIAGHKITAGDFLKIPR